MPDHRFIGKKVVITGAAGVFGCWIARAYAAEGARLFLTDLREEPLRNAASSLEAVEVHTHAADLTDESSADGLIAAVQQHWGRPISLSIMRVSIHIGH